MSDWIIDGPGTDPPSDAALLSEARHGMVRQAARRHLAIRLLEMIVHDNRRWLGEATIRIDVLIVHGGRSSGVEYAPTTFKFPRVSDGERLPIGSGGLLLFHGLPRRYLTMFITVSRDMPGVTPLSDLVSEIANSDPAINLEAQALAMATGVPDPQILALALRSTLAVGEVALNRLRKEDSSTIGIYRDCWLRGRDGWGNGRHPETGLLNAKDVSFAFEISSDQE